MAENSLVTNYAINAKAAVVSLQELAKSSKGVDDAMFAMAEQSADALERLTKRAGEGFERLSTGGKVSLSTFDGMLVSVDKLRDGIIAKFGDVESAPAELRQALDAARQTVVALGSAMQQGAVHTASLREEFKYADEAARALAEAEAKARAEQEALNELQEKAAALAKDVAEQYGDIPEKINDIRKAADKTFDQQVDDLKRIEKELLEAEKAYDKLGVEGVEALKALKPETAKVQQALREVASEAATANGKIKDSTVVAELAFANLAKQIRNNPKEAVEALPKVAGAVIQLKNTIQAAQAAGGPVDPSAIVNLRRFQDELEKAKLDVGGLKREIDQTTAGVTSATSAWQGLDGVVDQVAGRFGKLGVGIVGSFAALKEGVALGTTVAKAIGTDFSATEKAANGVQAALASITKALTTDGWGAAWEQGRAVAANFGNSVLASGAALDGFNAIVAAGVARADAMKLAQSDLVAIGQQYRVVVEGGVEALTLWRNTLASTPVEQWAEKLRALRTQFEAMRDAHQKSIEVEKKRQETIKASIDQIAEVIASLQRERAERALGVTSLEVEIEKRANLVRALQESSKAEAFAKDVKGGLSATMVTELELLKQSLASYQTNRVEVEKLTAALAADVELYRQGLTPEREKELRTLAEQLKKYGELDPVQRGSVQLKIEEMLRTRAATEATSKHAIVLDETTGRYTNLGTQAADSAVKIDKAARTITNTTEEAKKLQPELGRVSDAFKNVDTAAIRLGAVPGHFSDMGAAIKDSGPSIDDYDRKISALSLSLESLAVNAERAAKALKEVGKDDAAAVHAGAGRKIDAEGGGAFRGRGATGTW